MTTLGYLGYNTSAPTGPLAMNQLPVVFPLPAKVYDVVVGRSSVNEEETPADVALGAETLSAPQHRLMILYHASQADQVNTLIDLLDQTVDVPERQVLIEGMVVELLEEDFKEIGILWNRFGGRFTFIPDGERVPFMLSFSSAATPSSALAEGIRTLLRAVIQEGKAEVLSSPSVLVLNNRNARIKIVRDTPILSSKIIFDTTTADIRFEPVGIVLNIKPRISQDDSVVTMQIIAEVSEIPTGEELEVSGTVVAPAIDRRIVETVARVHNNMPFIIGGLIRNKKSRVLDRVPILSRIPIIGVWFRRSITIREKREVIIVLTPRVIPKGEARRPVLPKDSSRYDFLDNRLFRQTYRLKAEDVFDLRILENNERILSAFDRAQALVRKHPEYADKPPFNELAARVIPGEDAIVVRMIYEIAKDKLRLHQSIPTENLIFMRRDESKPAGFDVEWLANDDGDGILQTASPNGTVAGYFRGGYPRQVLVLRFRADPECGLDAALLSRVAQVEWLTVEGPGDKEAEEQIAEHLLAINVLGVDRRYDEYAVALNTPDDLTRLKAAVALREVAKVNDVGELTALRNFRVGRKFVIPELGSKERMFLVDRAAAGFFFMSDFYYETLKSRLEQSYEMLEQAIAREGLQ